MRGGTLLISLALVAALWQQLVASTGLSCQECLLVAKVLEAELVKLEPHHTQPPHPDIAGQPKPKRQMTHPRSEVQIFNTLETLCDKLPASGPQLVEGCAWLVEQYRDPLENRIYADGLEHVRRVLCTDLAGLCRSHALYDSGEL
ncbi:hypothetical protein WJX72_010276 [[Myrmecia] bisecta]|uniref:Saposin B-type domain-containing protein n=1 Tax=[Myrmecia] bisecta TaxID=41462 RepID=A0AAW1QB26_9CHLO